MMIKNFLLDILVHPNSKKPLQFFENSNTFSDSNNIFNYTVIDTLPIILSSEVDDVLSKSAIHAQYGTKFNYKAHYKIDAEFYNYFEVESTTTLKERERSRQAIICKVPSESKIILDVGCGGGWVANYFIKKKKQVISIDIISKKNAECLRKNDNYFNNTYFTELGIGNLLSFLPFDTCLGINIFLNTIIPKPSIFLIETTKDVE